MATACFYFDGFWKSELGKTPNALSAWLETTSDLSEAMINCRINASDSLRRRWDRANALLDRIRKRRGAAIRILGYSIGCHLAVKFACGLAEKRRAKHIDLWLLAPDPKFVSNVLDEREPPSAYGEAQELWNTHKSPGKRLCSALNHLSGLTDEGQIEVIYSTGDTVALWEGNAELMNERCGGDRLRWSPVAINSTTTIGGVTFRLRPRRASSEYWIHQQLFTMASGRDENCHAPARRRRNGNG